MLKQERSIDQMLEKNKNFNQVEKYFIKTRLQFVICHFILIMTKCPRDEKIVRNY